MIIKRPSKKQKQHSAIYKVDGYTVLVTKQKRKTATIKISPSNDISVNVPLQFSLQSVTDFVTSHAHWIDKQIKKNTASYEKIAPKTYENGDLFL